MNNPRLERNKNASMREHQNQSDNLETVISLSNLEENTNIQGKIMQI